MNAPTRVVTLLLFACTTICTITVVQSFAPSSCSSSTLRTFLLSDKVCSSRPPWSSVPSSTTFPPLEQYSRRRENDISSRRTTTTTTTTGDIIGNIASDVSVDSITGSFGQALTNMQEGEFGKRGELYFIAQAALIFCILGGGFPLIGTTVTILFGVALILVGAVVIVAGISELGDALSPWPVPTSQSVEIKQSGILSYIRHPLYAGLMYMMLGISITSDSASRVLLTGLLYYVMNLKTDYEENELVKRFGEEYEIYKRNVPGRFVPAELTDQISSLIRGGVGGN